MTTRVEVFKLHKIQIFDAHLDSREVYGLNSAWAVQLGLSEHEC